jgi:hypothetical protein
MVSWKTVTPIVCVIEMVVLFSVFNAGFLRFPIVLPPQPYLLQSVREDQHLNQNPQTHGRVSYPVIIVTYIGIWIALTRHC